MELYYENQAAGLQEVNRIIHEDRFQEAALERLAREALAGRQERTTNLISAMLDWVRKLARQEPCTTPEPAS